MHQVIGKMSTSGDETEALQPRPLLPDATPPSFPGIPPPTHPTLHELKQPPAQPQGILGKHVSADIHTIEAYLILQPYKAETRRLAALAEIETIYIPHFHSSCTASSIYPYLHSGIRYHCLEGSFTIHSKASFVSQVPLISFGQVKVPELG